MSYNVATSLDPFNNEQKRLTQGLATKINGSHWIRVDLGMSWPDSEEAMARIKMINVNAK